MQASNGESLVHPDPWKLKGHNAKFLDGRKRQAIITALANGESRRSIARRLSTSKNTIAVIARENWTQVDARKQRIAAQAELNATLAAERITDELQSDKQIPLNVLVPVFGVNVDKLLGLRGDVQLTIRHEHLHARLSDNDVWDYMIARSKQDEKTANAEVIPETHQLAEKTRSKKKVL
jgi:IS30 family transposase